MAISLSHLPILFEHIMILSIEATLLIAFIFIVQYVCKHQLGIRWQYALWFVLVAKLSIMWLPTQLTRPFEWLSISDKLHITGLINSTTEEAASIRGTIAGEPVNTTGVVQTIANQSDLLSWTNIAIVIWVLGMVFILSHILIAHLKQANSIRKESLPSVPYEAEQLFNRIKVKLRVKRKLLFRQSNLVKSPSLFGLFKPVVLIPAYMLQQMSEDELTYVIVHELSHYKRKDILVNCWCTLIAIIHWFNPIIWYGLYRMRVDQEISCDARTIDLIGYDQKTNYATAIVKLLELGNSSRMISTQIGLFGYRGQIKRRIIMIKSLSRMKYRNSIIGLIAAVILVIIALPQSQIGQAQSTEDMILVNPVEGTITTQFGFINKGSDQAKKQQFHDGIDIQNEEGAIITAVAAGTITAAEYDPIHGNTITIRHNDEWSTRYDHLLHMDVKIGANIEQGQRIALLGTTGASTGPHLHFAIMINGDYVDPENLLYLSSEH